MAMTITTESHKSFVRLLEGPVILLLSCAVAPAREEPPQDALANPDYLEFVSLREAMDATHRVGVMDPDGKTWYREEAAGLNLGHLRLAETYVMHGVDGKSFTVMLWIDRSEEKRWLE
jgi:hypothetical protein